jgi:hypothetical protein
MPADTTPPDPDSLGSELDALATALTGIETRLSAGAEAVATGTVRWLRQCAEDALGALGGDT